MQYEKGNYEKEQNNHFLPRDTIDKSEKILAFFKTPSPSPTLNSWCPSGEKQPDLFSTT